MKRPWGHQWFPPKCRYQCAYIDCLRVLFQVQEYKDSLKQKAEHLIIKGFPEKIVKLNELLEKSNFQNRDLADVHQVIVTIK